MFGDFLNSQLFWHMETGMSGKSLILNHLYCKVHKIEQFNHLNMCINVLENINMLRVCWGDFCHYCDSIFFRFAELGICYIVCQMCFYDTFAKCLHLTKT